MSQPFQHSSASLLESISRNRSVGSPFTPPATSSRRSAPMSMKGSKPVTSPTRSIAKSKKEGLGSVTKAFISARCPKGGSTRYCVQIRRRTDQGSVSASKTFSTLVEAKKWRDDTLAKIQLGEMVPKTNKDETNQVLVSGLLQRKIENGRSMERSAIQTLELLIQHDRCHVSASTIVIDWFMAMADDLLDTGMLPQTAASYMSMLASSLKWAAKRKADVPYNVIVQAMEILWEDEILARSEERERRPSLEELDQIFNAVLANKRQKIPVITISVFAIYSCRRLSEICRLRWSDLNVSESTILVREMKHPRKKKGNNVTVNLPPEALKIILSMPRTSEFIFPYNPRSAGTAFRRHRKLVEIEDLRFHDLRHEGISLLFEKGERDHFVMKTSGHQSRQCLDRYVNVQRAGDKFENWHWLDWVISYWNTN
mgnify:FL=1